MPGFSKGCKDCINRRRFIRSAFFGLSGLTVGSLVAVTSAGCSDNGPIGSSADEDTIITLDLTESQYQNLNIVGGSATLSGNELDSNGILVYRAGETSVKAYSRSCTHQGCQVGGFSSGFSSCGCHGSRFNTSGAAVQGPATTSLTQYSAGISGNIVTITG